jgi:hypothetical protein
MDNPDAAIPYLAKFQTRAAKTSFVGPGRGISGLNQDEVLKMAKEKGLKGADKATSGYGFSGKLGLDYRPTENQLLKDLVNVILPNAQGQSKEEVQRLNQLRKLVKPYEKDPSKMPGGIKAALQDMFAIHDNMRISNPYDERINIPGDPKHYWRYRMHIPIEELIKNDNFNNDLQYCIISNGR